MTQKKKVGAVSYLNTKPLVYGFEHGEMKNEIELVMDYPAKVASMLCEGLIDIGLVPVAIIPSLKNYSFISDYCIGCNGAVASVCLFSDVEMDKIERILLDYQSKTSVALLKILLKMYWNVSPELIPAKEGYEAEIKGTTAGLVIGDRAFKQRLNSIHSYDLGLAWKSMTGLPFVFAAWVAREKPADDFIQSFNACIKSGINNINEIATINQQDNFDIKKYYLENINYTFDEQSKKGLYLFLEKINTIL